MDTVTIRRNLFEFKSNGIRKSSAEALSHMFGPVDRLGDRLVGPGDHQRIGVAVDHLSCVGGIIYIAQSLISD